MYKKILSDIGIVRGNVLFVHSSMNWIGGGVTEGIALIEALLDAVGPSGTLVMPSYAWRGSPVEGGNFDVRKTPSAVGLLTELFRRWPGVHRSAHYWVPVCAYGQDAVYLTKDQTSMEHAFACDSTFRRLSELEALVVGLGVSLNTSSLAHLPDYDLQELYSFAAFAKQPLYGTVIDSTGACIATKSIVVPRELLASYQPSALFSHSTVLSDALMMHERGKAIFFAYPAALYHCEGVRIGRAALALGKYPPWIRADGAIADVHA